MKLSCQEHLVPGNTLKEKWDWLEENGFQGIELWAFDMNSKITEIKKAVAQSSQVQISALCGGYEGNLFDPSIQAKKSAVAGVKQLIQSASEIGAPGIILVPSFGTSQSLGVLNSPQSLLQKDIESFAETLSELAEEAQRYDVQLYLEPINRYESFAFHQVKQVAEVCAIVHSPVLSLLVDTFHMNIEEASISETIEKYHSYIGYVHFADSNRLVPGYGHIDFPDILRTLQKVNYDGFVSLECFIRHEQDLIEARKYIWSATKQVREG